MAHQHLVLAYIVTWVIQLGYLCWIGAKWAAVRKEERRIPAYPERSSDPNGESSTAVTRDKRKP
jgi:hypothetical protein